MSINSVGAGSSTTPAPINFSLSQSLVYSVGKTLTLAATSGAPGTITYVSDNPSVISVSGNTATVLSVGTARITASIRESQFYYANTKTLAVLVTPIVSTLTFTPPTSSSYGSADIPLSVITNSPNAVSYTSDNPYVVSIVGNAIRIVGVGSANITASIPAGNNYSAVSVTQNLAVSKGTPTLSISIPSQIDTNSAPITLNATTNSPGAVSYSSSNASVISISGNVATIMADGSATITVTVPETATYYGIVRNFGVTIAPSSAASWTPYGTYSVDQYVWFSGNIYQCKTANTGVVTTNGAVWQLIKTGSVVFDNDANAYFTAVGAVSSISANNQNAINSFVASLKAAGVWGSIKQSNLLVGPTSLAGALVPIAGNAPINYLNRFVDSDYNYCIGLKGDGSTKYLNTGRANNADANQSSRHIYVCTTQNAVVSGSGIYLLGSGSISGEARIYQTSTTSGSISMGLVSSTQAIPTTFQTINGFGMNRNSSTTVIPFVNGNLAMVTNNVLTPSVTNIGIFATGSGVGKSDARIAFYSIGDSADVSIIDACVKTLLSALV